MRIAMIHTALRSRDDMVRDLVSEIGAGESTSTWLDERFDEIDLIKGTLSTMYEEYKKQGFISRGASKIDDKHRSEREGR